MTWEPSDALVEKAARELRQASYPNTKLGPWEALPDQTRDSYLDQARAALIAARDDMVAEAVRAEAEACAKLADHDASTDSDDRWHRGYSAACRVIRNAIRARHP